mmetsp:Transcript_8824/g.26801  ORF Transcript_8824/g.26801 Transcript_8824/m.26801 type:complete len:218 (-) Transcript_8824:3794-4447(-)
MHRCRRTRRNPRGHNTMGGRNNMGAQLSRHTAGIWSCLGLVATPWRVRHVCTLCSSGIWLKQVRSSRPQPDARLFEDVLPDFGVLWERLDDLVAHVHSVDKALRLEVVEGKLVADLRRRLVLVLPCLLIVLCSVLVALLALHDSAHVLPRARTALIVLERLLAQILREVKLAALHVDVSQQQPRFFKLLVLVRLVRDLLHALELVACLGRLLDEHEA